MNRRQELLWWLWHSEKIGAQVALLLAALFWCVGLLLEPEAMALPAYKFMSKFGNDYGWAAAWAGNFVVQLVALRCRARKFYLLAGAWACTLHVLACYNFVDWRFTNGQGWPVAISAELSLAVVAFLIYVFAPVKMTVKDSDGAGLHQGTG